MKYFFLFILSLILLSPSTLLATVDRTACDNSPENFLPLSSTSDGVKDFLKICLPNGRETGSNTVTGMANANIKGGLLQIGNQVICAMDENISTTECIDPESKVEYRTNDGYQQARCADETWQYVNRSGYTKWDGCQNNDFASGPDSAYLGLADYDNNISRGISAAEANTTSSSSMASLSLKTGDSVYWAKLYWMGRTNSSDDNDFDDVKNVKLLTPTTSGIYKDITCTHYGSTGHEYYCSAEVTQYVSQSGEYWVGNVVGSPNTSNNFSAWALLVVYQNDVDPFTNIAIYEGFQSFFGSSLSIPLSGFLTPAAGTVDARFHVLAGESDNGYTDELKVQDKAGNARLVINPVGSDNDFLNATVSRYGSLVTNRLPNFNNAMGIDVDSVNLQWNDAGTAKSILDNNQSSTVVQFRSYNDQLYVPLIGFSTEIYQPNICYDYAYYQNSRAFTEENNGSLNVQPHIVGDYLSTTDPIEVRLLIKNLEPNSYASNVKLNITDLNATSEVVYSGNLLRTDPGGLLYKPITPTASNTANVSYDLTDSGVSMGTLASVYSSFEVMPSKSSINVPLNMSLDFSIALSGGITLDYNGLKLKDDIPLCTTQNFAYTPEWGIFNALDRSLYNSTGKYNLFTQTSSRKYDVDIVSTDPADPTVEKPISTVVSVALVDVGGWHDNNATCDDDKNLITLPVWITFDNNVSKVEFDVDQAIADGMTDLTNSNDFYKVARQSVAFRLSYNVTNDGNGDLIQLSKKANGDYLVLNYPQLVQNIGTCAQPVRFNPNTANTTVQVATACGNAGTAGVNPWELKQCLKCLYGINTVNICSRDNFSIRPEAFNVKIYDRNTTDQTEILNESNISARYMYKYDINATNHLDSNATPGYTQHFFGGTESNISYDWSPYDLHVVTGCNDFSNDDINTSLKEGSIINLAGMGENVGRYLLSMIDKIWTKADQNPAHHSSNYFLNSSNGGTGSDCIIDNDIVPLYNSASGYVANMVGCDIKSEHHNIKADIEYHDYNITIRPYDFNISTIRFEKGFMDLNTTVTAANAFVYNNNLTNNTDDLNMSLRYRGRLRAVGADDVNLSNFVNNCYSESVNLDINTSDINVTIAPPYVFRLRQKDDDNVTVLRDNIRGNNGGQPTLIGRVTFPDTNFDKNMSGETEIELNVNFSREVNTSVNPISLMYDDLNVSCTTLANCQSYADVKPNHDPEGLLDTQQVVSHIYGRMHAPRYRSATATANVPIYYEFYCDAITGCDINDINYTTISPNALLSPDDIRWYNQTTHNVIIDGNATATQARNANDNNRFTTKVIDPGAQNGTYTYDGSRGYPYKATMEINASDWLIYDRFDPTAADVNTFELEFSSTGQWSGQDRSLMQVDSNASATTNRRVEW